MVLKLTVNSVTTMGLGRARVIGEHLLCWIVGSCGAAELMGYLLHRLLHSGLIGFLSRNHMKHHLILYGPQRDQRPDEGYADATENELAIGNVGLEWLLPGGIILLAALSLLWLLQVPFLYRIAFLGTSLVWSFLVFSYLHDRMHLKGFWMEHNPFLKRWFCRARNLHDIHHRVLNDSGLMDKNFGIGFAFFDWLFGTMTSVEPPFNDAGLVAANRRFQLVLEPETHEETHDELWADTPEATNLGTRSHCPLNRIGEKK